ncbi:hypothetical protein [Methylobacterium sp. B4]|uniref:hypothetical protein n=1 Tax=Methylobacterium sp. B4 TaxID=1938755 RepID=UPI000D8AE581|nr:hypothetical protein [Methylobacterium sp. B4]PXW57730.1 hypothetical protein BY998_1137 [Methylobacterium sp. B4]
MNISVAGARIQDAHPINHSLYNHNSSLCEYVDEAVEAPHTDPAASAPSAEEAAHTAPADAAESLNPGAIGDSSLGPASLCKKGGAGRSRRDPLASLVFVGEALTEMGLIQPHRDARRSVNTSKGYTPPSPSPSKKLSYLEMRVRTAPTIPGTTTKKPQPWRDLDDHAQVIFAFLGLQAAGPVIGFTANLSEAVATQAYAQPKPGPWLHKRVREQIDRMFGSAIDFVATYEEARDPRTGKRRLHVHGILGLDLTSRRRADKARAAMKAAFGTWERPGKGHQIEFSHEIDVGWSSYIAKDARLASASSRRFAASVGAGHLAPLFEGPVVTMTHGTTRLAKDAAERARQIVTEARKRPSAPLPQPSSPEALPAAGESPRRLAHRVPRCRALRRRPTLTNRRLRPLHSSPTTGRCRHRPPLSLPVAPRRPVLHALLAGNRTRGPPDKSAYRSILIDGIKLAVISQIALARQRQIGHLLMRR